MFQTPTLSLTPSNVRGCLADLPFAEVWGSGDEVCVLVPNAQSVSAYVSCLSKEFAVTAEGLLLSVKNRG